MPRSAPSPTPAPRTGARRGSRPCKARLGREARAHASSDEGGRLRRVAIKRPSRASVGGSTIAVSVIHVEWSTVKRTVRLTGSMPSAPTVISHQWVAIGDSSWNEPRPARSSSIITATLFVFRSYRTSSTCSEAPRGMVTVPGIGPRSAAVGRLDQWSRVGSSSTISSSGGDGDGTSSGQSGSSSKRSFWRHVPSDAQQPVAAVRPLFLTSTRMITNRGGNSPATIARRCGSCWPTTSLSRGRLIHEATAGPTAMPTATTTAPAVATADRISQPDVTLPPSRRGS